ncbi:MAG: tetratricopeptide repeat protein [Burkholderiales bacterium]
MKRAPRRIRALVCLIIILAGAPALAAGQQSELPVPDAWAALEKGDASRAAGLFREALERNPRSAVLHFGAGWAAFALGRHGAAISSLKKAVEYDASFPQAATLLAQVAYASGDLDLAIRSLERAVALRPAEFGLRQQLEQWRKESALHAGFDSLPGVRFRVMFEGAAQQAVGARVEQVLESAYWTIGKTLNSYPSETLTVVLYTDRQFQDVTRLPGWAGGAYDGRIRLAVGGAMRTPAALDRLVRHELVHAVIDHAAPRNIPAWLHEGLASALESPDRAWIAAALREVREVYSLDDLSRGFGHLDGPSARIAYAESALAAEILRERLGPNLGVFVQMVGNGHTVDQALSTLNVQPETFHGEWRRRLGVR